ncbi:nucleotidyltransferase domain-containing protein [Candidatus Saganbacteria bacterium]|nr:nucleotidyltransferase domain-containing protein [Candidatus Saganbacteria bacterium]
MSEELEKILKELKAGLKRIHGDNLKHLFLYGSHARGDAAAESDIDVLMILIDYNNIWEIIQKNSELVQNICLKHGVVISLIPIKEFKYNTFKTPLILNVRKEGIAL